MTYQITPFDEALKALITDWVRDHPGEHGDSELEQYLRITRSLCLSAGAVAATLAGIAAESMEE